MGEGAKIGVTGNEADSVWLWSLKSSPDCLCRTRAELRERDSVPGGPRARRGDGRHLLMLRHVLLQLQGGGAPAGELMVTGQ